MATKIIDVTLATLRNYGTRDVTPEGYIWAMTTRAVDDEQVFQTEVLYHGAITIPPGQSVTVGINKRLTVQQFDPQETQGYNQMLVLHADLKQQYFHSGNVGEVPYYGLFMRKIRFDDINGFFTMTHPCNTTLEHKFEAIFTINVVSSY
ncbi:hypothetical protein [Bacillus cereus]